MNNNLQRIKTKPYIILVAGIPASGKTTYARHIASKLGIPLICKDAIKEILYDSLKWDTSAHDNTKRYGAASYHVFYHVCESLMKAGVSFVAESNFIQMSVDKLLPIIKQHDYRPLTVLMDADLAVLHKRFYDRDKTDERHPGLVVTNDNSPKDFEGFCSDANQYRDFCVGDKIVVDTTDLANLSYERVDAEVLAFSLKPIRV